MPDTPTVQINNPPAHPGDHDLLIRLDEKMDGVKSDIKELKDNIGNRVENLETDKLSKDDFKSFKDEEFTPVRDDVKSLSRYMWIAIGAIALVQLYLFYREAFPNSHF